MLKEQEAASVEEKKPSKKKLDAKVSIQKIIESISERETVVIYYEGEGVKGGFRVIQPHLLGKGLKIKGKLINNDKIYLRSYVLKEYPSGTAISSIQRHKIMKKVDPYKGDLPSSSTSLTEHKPYWRNLRVDRITLWFPIFGMAQFSLKQGYNRLDKDIISKIKTA